MGRQKPRIVNSILKQMKQLEDRPGTERNYLQKKHLIKKILLFSSVQFISVQSLSRVRLFATPWIAAHQASPSITNSRSLLKIMPTESVMPSSHLILGRPLLLLPSVPPNIRVFSSEFQLQHHYFQRNPTADLLQNGLVGSPCSPRDSQESSPTPQFKSINTSAVSLLHSPTLTSIHDHWKNHSLD